MFAKATTARKMTVPTDQAWDAISRVGRLDIWFPSIATCVVEWNGKNATRTMNLRRGGKIVDRIVDVDPGRKRLVYNRIEHPFPATSYVGTVEVLDSFDDLAVVVWTVDFESAAEVSETLKSELEAAIGAGVEGMKIDLATRS